MPQFGNDSRALRLHIGEQDVGARQDHSMDASTDNLLMKLQSLQIRRENDSDVSQCVKNDSGPGRLFRSRLRATRKSIMSLYDRIPPSDRISRHTSLCLLINKKPCMLTEPSTSRANTSCDTITSERGMSLPPTLSTTFTYMPHRSRSNPRTDTTSQSDEV